jgi:hypothetical protein
MQNKEQLLNFFLSGVIKLSQYDYKFMANLLTMVQNSDRVTSNQAKLFDNLINKYKRQLTKNGLDEKELSDLSWSTRVVESSIEYTGALVSLIDDSLVIKVPFNKSFIKALTHANKEDLLDFVWDSAEKVYRARFTTMTLKIAYNMLPKYFVHVKYCDIIQAMLTELEQYRGLLWNPTAKKVNGRLVIGACNEVLGSLITDENLEITPVNLFNLTRMKIKIDPDVYFGDEKLKFAASEIYEIDGSRYKEIVRWMKEIGCDEVLLGRGMSGSSTWTGWKTDFVKEVGSEGIKVHGNGWISSAKSDKAILVQHFSSTASPMQDRSACKIIIVKDSSPVDISNTDSKSR